jgi:dTDP-4-dehydrorhamnose 3,5-epimerase-like enzyme
LFQLQEITDARGCLSVLEEGSSIPFPVRRVFFTYGIPESTTRGGHAHRKLEEILVCVGGSLAVHVDDGAGGVTVRLAEPRTALYIPPMVWSELFDFSPGTVYLVLASLRYDAADYVHDYGVFRALASGRAACPLEVSHARSSL